jgi:hypothetical protein
MRLLMTSLSRKGYMVAFNGAFSFGEWLKIFRTRLGVLHAQRYLRAQQPVRCDYPTPRVEVDGRRGLETPARPSTL